MAMKGPVGFAERCLVTVLAVDTVDSTGHVANIDPDRAQELLDRIFDHLKHAVEAADGLLVSYSGDGGLAVFGWPKSLEDHADRACEAAWRIQTPAALANPVRNVDGQPVRFRVGVHSGLVNLRSMRRDVRTGINTVGGAVHLAAALQKSAPHDGILLSSKTVSLCRSTLQLAPHHGVPALQKVRLKAFELLENPSRSALVSEFRQYQSPFIGRQRERRGLEEALFGDESGAVALIGEPGIGKTRLASIAVDEAKSRGTRVLVFNGDNQKRTTPFSAIRTLILQSLSVKAAVSDDEIPLALLEAGAGEMQPAAATVMLGERAAQDLKPPSFTRTQVARALVETLFALIKRAPALIVVDNVQLLDPESILCLRLIAKATAGPRRALLMTARPESAALVRTLAGVVLNLAPLPREDMAELARKLWPTATPGPDAFEKVLDRADGVPFVLEQLALSQGIDFSDQEGGLPESVQSLIHARLNQLSVRAKALAQTLSILGEEVDLDLASRTLGIGDEALLRGRSELERLEFVHSPIAGSIRFRHDIVREACAETVPGARRQQIHRAAMEAILSRPVAEYERLAFHAEGARDDAAALEWLWRAALKARRASAGGSLSLTLKRAMACIERIGEPAEEKFVDFVLMAFGSLAQIGEFRSLAADLPRALELATKQNRKSKVCAALCHMGLVCWFEARYAEGREHSERAVEIATELDSLPLIFAAKFNLASALYGLGALDSAIALQRELCVLLTGELEMARLGAAGVPGSIVRSYLCWFLTEVGGYDEGLALVERAIDIARTQGDPYSELLGLLAKSQNLIRRSRYSEAIACLEQGGALIERNGYDAILPHIVGTLASARARCGQGPRAVAEVETWLNSEREHRTGPLELFHLNAGYAEALLSVGDAGQALAVADRAVEISRSISNPCLMARGLSVRARVREKARDPGGAHSDRAEQKDLCRRYGIAESA
jgi:class 3 adenylate cyclase/tetratricopeptide (TPR) repeat protein